MNSKLSTVAERIRYIESLELCNTPEILKALPAQPIESETGKGVVDEGSVISFLGNISQQSVSDVSNSMLLAQLAARKKFDPERESEQYYEMYRDVLGNIGWVISSFSFHQFQSASASIDLGDVVLNLLRAIASDSAVRAVVATIAALKALSSESRPSLIFNTSTHSDKNGNFRVAVCQETNQTVSTSISNTYFESKETVSSIFWTKFTSADMNLHYATQNITLNRDIYSQVRRQVITKLGDKAKQYIADIEI